jgi:hypothetical protein
VEDVISETCTHGGMRNAYSVLVGRFGVKRLLGRPKCRWRKCKINLKKYGLKVKIGIN